jgi:hypothetical protein
MQHSHSKLILKGEEVALEILNEASHHLLT